MKQTYGGGGATRPLPRGGGMEETPRRPNSRATPKGLDSRRWRAGETRMRDS